jgi:hypothetical protein
MVGLVITVLTALLLLFVSLVFFLHGDKATANLGSSSRSIAGLSAVHIQRFDILLDEKDHHKLLTRPELKLVHKRFRRNRRRIVLMWLRELQNDVHITWEFRRFLVRNGLRTTFGQEVNVLYAACSALLCLAIARACAFILGPFALTGILRNARGAVERLSGRGAGLLDRLPEQRKTEIERKWAQQVLLLSIGHPTYVA